MEDVGTILCPDGLARTWSANPALDSAICQAAAYFRQKLDKLYHELFLSVF
jgi:hypothetical protein